MPTARVGVEETNSKAAEKRSAEVDVTAWIRKSSRAKQSSNTTNQNNKTDQANAFDQLCNLIHTRYQQSSANTDKRALRRRRQLLKELEAVNQTLFSFA